MIAAAGPQAYLARTMDLSPGDYRLASADLNGDGRAEAIVYVTNMGYCGSGGCDLVVLSPTRGGWRRVAKTTITWPPISVLATSSHDWRDLGVTVGGGGVGPGYMARLRFDGRRYASNPTVSPAIRLPHPAGRVVLEK